LVEEPEEVNEFPEPNPKELPKEPVPEENKEGAEE
jgi:hypothetical protein